MAVEAGLLAGQNAQQRGERNEEQNWEQNGQRNRPAGNGHWPVIIVGAGPTGLTLANLLGGYGVRTLLIERHPSTVGEPRAVSIDDESLRTMQNAGVLDEVLPDVVQGYGVHYHAWNNRVFARVLPTSLEYGHPKRSAFRQPLLEATLHRTLARHASVEARFSHELKRMSQDELGVRIQVAHEGGEDEYCCDWLIACDGGRSPMRDMLGIPLQGETYAERWLIVDLMERSTPFRHTRTYCDPVRPTIRLPGPHGSLRYEFMLHEGETPEDVLDEARIRAWMREREPLDEHLPIIRKVVYTFHARMAPQWRSGRVLLAGDAAHLTPPFAGQGMNSGVRDAFNLAWKLAEVTAGRAGPKLLESYEQERAPHAWSLIRMALAIGRYMQPKTRASAIAMQAALRVMSLYPPVRDYVLHLKFKPKPRFAQGFFVPRDPGDKKALRPGQLFPQPKVELPGGKRVLLDDLLGRGYARLLWVDQAVTALPGDWPHRTIHLVPADQDFPLNIEAGSTVLRDCDGVLAAALAQMNAKQVLLRPDRYVLAAWNAADAVPVMEALRRLCATDNATAANEVAA